MNFSIKFTKKTHKHFNPILIPTCKFFPSPITLPFCLKILPSQLRRGPGIWISIKKRERGAGGRRWRLVLNRAGDIAFYLDKCRQYKVERLAAILNSPPGPPNLSNWTYR